MTEPAPLQQVDRTYARLRGRKLSYFSGCDYFRMASHPRLSKAVLDGIKHYGLNVAASRMTSGNHVLYSELENSLRTFFEAPAALLVATGYLANLVVAQTLAGNFSHVLIDAEAHPSLVDATRFLDCPVLRFKHCDSEDLARTVRRCGVGTQLLLLTEGLFARDGMIAPLPDYVRVLPKDAWILVDDAHAAGVLGRTGSGSLEHSNLPRKRVIQTLTLSKAFGAYGGVILGSVALRENMVSRSQIFAGSTPIPLPLANAALHAISILTIEGNTLRKRLNANAARVRDGLRDICSTINQVSGPIITIVPESERLSTQLTRELLRAKIYPPFIRYPGGLDSGCFRFAISSEHRSEQLDRLIRVLSSVLGSSGRRKQPERLPNEHRINSRKRNRVLT